MAGADLWPQVHRQRTAAADMLDGLDSAQWELPTLCRGWLVRDMVAHLIATGHTTPGSFLAGLLSAGFRFNAMSAKQIARRRDHSPEQLVRELRDTATLRNRPPGPVETPLSEIVVHSADIAKPLGLHYDAPAETLVTVAEFYKKAQLLIGAKRRIAGLQLRATDADWQTGSGPEVAGPILSLLLVMAGRRPALGDLTGNGVAQLSARMP